MSNTPYVVDMYEASDYLRVARERIAGVDRLEIAADNRTLTQVRADVTKHLLFAAHLAEKARLAIMDQYFAVKGESEHMYEPNS